MTRNTTYTKRQLYERLFVSSLDLGLARQFAAHLLKKGWHSAPYERRGSIYMQQAAFTTSLIVSYSRPFKYSCGWPDLPKNFKQYDTLQQQLHKKLLGLRDQIYAHSDSAYYSIKPFRIDTELVTDIEGVPFLRLSKAQCEQVIVMIDGIQQRLSPCLKKLRGELADRNET